jgi:hypothetical protein
MTKTAFLTSLVRYKGSHDWEVAFADVPITYTSEIDRLHGMAGWVERRILSYPPEQWEYWTTLCKREADWRSVKHLPAGFDPSSPVAC